MVDLWRWSVREVLLYMTKCIHMQILYLLVSVYTFSYIHIQIYIYICICIYIFIAPNVICTKEDGGSMILDLREVVPWPTRQLRIRRIHDLMKLFIFGTSNVFGFSDT